MMSADPGERVKRNGARGAYSGAEMKSSVHREVNYLCYRLLLGQPVFGDAAMSLRKCFLKEPGLLPQSSSSDMIPLQDFDEIYRKLPHDFLITIIKAGYESLCKNHPEIQTGSLLLPDLFSVLMIDKKKTEEHSNERFSSLSEPHARLLGLRRRQRQRTGIVATEFFSKMALRRTIKIHRSRVTCLLSDRSGQRLITASSDGIIKVWDQSSMVLLHVIRAFPDQNAGVSCMDVSLDNRMLASGGQEALKFWSLKDGALLFALRTLPAKAVNVAFSLATAMTHRSLLVSCSDGSFWSLPFRWDEMASSPAIFSELQRLAVGPGDEPSRNERPPIAQSPNGTFVATGYGDGSILMFAFDADLRRFTRVARMASFHCTRIRYLAFIRTGPAFVSGSDEAVSVWECSAQHRFGLARRIPVGMNPSGTNFKRRNSHFIGAVLCFRDSRLICVIGSQLYSLNLTEGHIEYIQCLSRSKWHTLESCPANTDVVVVAGDDGVLQLFRAATGRLVKDLSLPRARNNLAGESAASRAILRAVFSSCGSHLAAVDARGQLHALSLTPRALYDNDAAIPTDYFFHTEFGEVDFDAQLQPFCPGLRRSLHLLPPPYIVDVTGEVQGEQTQRLVPGRELFSRSEDLLPTTSSIVNMSGTKVIDDAYFVGEDAEPAFLECMNAQKMYLTESVWKDTRSLCPRVEVHSSNAAHLEWNEFMELFGVRDGFPAQELHAESRFTSGSSTPLTGTADAADNEEMDDSVDSDDSQAMQARRRRPSRLRQRPRATYRFEQTLFAQACPPLVAREAAEPTSDFGEDEERDPDWSNPALDRSQPSRASTPSPRALPPRLDGRPRRTVSYRFRHTFAAARGRLGARRGVRRQRMGGSSKSRSRSTSASLCGEEEEEDEEEEEEEMRNEEDEEEDMVEGEEAKKEEKEEEENASVGCSNAEDAKASTSRKEDVEFTLEEDEIEAQEEVEAEEEEGDEEEESSVGLREEREALEEEEEEAVETSNSSASSDEDRSESSRSSQRPRRHASRAARERLRLQEKELEKENKVRRRPAKACKMAREEIEALVEANSPPDWMTDWVPWPNRCAPQKGEVVVYHRGGHREYLKSARELRNEEGALVGKETGPPHSTFRVIHVSYLKLTSGERVADLRLKPWSAEDPDDVVLEALADDELEKYPLVRYEDLDGLLSYLTPVRLFEDASRIVWSVGARCKAIIDDRWWYGVIAAVDEEAVARGDFWLCLTVRWCNNEGEEESISPWDLLPVTGEEADEAAESQAVDITKLPSMLPRRGWWGADGVAERAAAVVREVARLAEATEFRQAVDLFNYPVYAAIIPHPMDLATIEKRIINNFYRSLAALLSDCELLEANAVAFNLEGSEIVERARFIGAILGAALRPPGLRPEQVRQEAASARQVLRETYKANLKRTPRKRRNVHEEEDGVEDEEEEEEELEGEEDGPVAGGRRIRTRMRTGRLPMKSPTVRRTSGRYPARRNVARLRYVDSDEEEDEWDSSRDSCFSVERKRRRKVV